MSKLKEFFDNTPEKWTKGNDAVDSRGFPIPTDSLVGVL